MRLCAPALRLRGSSQSEPCRRRRGRRRDQHLRQAAPPGTAGREGSLPNIAPGRPRRVSPPLMTTANQTPRRLFRAETLLARELAWQGRPALSLGLPTAFTTVASVALAAATAALVMFGSYTRRVDLEGAAPPDSGLIAISAPAGGWIEALAVREGAAVDKGAPLYTLDVDSATKGGIPSGWSTTRWKPSVGSSPSRSITRHEPARRRRARCARISTICKSSSRSWRRRSRCSKGSPSNSPANTRNSPGCWRSAPRR